MFVYTFKRPAHPKLSYDPFVWIAGRYFLREDKVMLNSPWLDLPILPIKPRGGHFANVFPPQIHNYPERLNDTLARSPNAKAVVQHSADFILFVGYPFPSWISISTLTDPQHQWSCQTADWLRLCAPSSKPIRDAKHSGA